MARACLRRPVDAAGILLEQPFSPGGNEPRDAGRRAIVELSLSLASNSVAVCLGEDRLALHCLAYERPSADRTWPA